MCVCVCVCVCGVCVCVCVCDDGDDDSDNIYGARYGSSLAEITDEVKVKEADKMLLLMMLL